MISGRNKLTFVDAKSGSSKNIVKKRPGLLSLNSLTLGCAAEGLPVWLIPGLQGHLGSCRSCFRAACVRNLSTFSLFQFPTFCAS